MIGLSIVPSPAPPSRAHDKILRREGRLAEATALARTTGGRLGEPSLPRQTKNFVVCPAKPKEIAAARSRE
jgi:hypothetical protein